MQLSSIGSPLNGGTWSNDKIEAAEGSVGIFGVRALYLEGIPLEVISCVDRIDVPPGHRAPA